MMARCSKTRSVAFGRTCTSQTLISVYIKKPLPKAQGFAYPFRCI
jgi:hypothetical protein